MKSNFIKTTERLALTLVLATMSNAVLAEWVEIEKFDDGMRVYVDKATVRRSGNTAEVSHLVRWGEAQLETGKSAYLSTIVRTAYNCADKGEKYLASISYTGAMGNGDRVISDENEAPEWYSISASSMEDKLWKIACGLN